MKTTFDNIEYIIKKLVEYQVKQWCSDVHYDQTLKLLPLHNLAVAKHIASDIGYDKRVNSYDKIKHVSCHARPYWNICELNEDAALKIPFIIDKWEFNNPDTEFGKRWVTEGDKKIAKNIASNYIENYGQDTVILFLMENECDIVRDGKIDDNKREFEDERIRNGRCIAAVEVYSSMWGREFTDSELSTYKNFREIFGNKIKNGATESDLRQLPYSLSKVYEKVQ